MGGIKRLSELLANLAPRLGAGEYVFLTFADAAYGSHPELEPVACFREREGLTLVVPRQNATESGADFDVTFRMITLEVHSDLEAVGLTAAVADALRSQGIPANVIAAFHHDHVFVPTTRAPDAVAVLRQLTQTSQHDP